MKFLTLLSAAILLCLSTVTMAGTDKVEVCHIPPGSPAEFHTITVSGKAVEAHLAHGDFEGNCGTYAGVLCDDGNMCTQDRFYDGTETCEANIEVDTDDSNSCTVDSCDPATGNVNTALADGEACDDGSGAGTCTAGVCGGAAGADCSAATLGAACDASSTTDPGYTCLFGTSGPKLQLNICVETTGCNAPDVTLPCYIFGFDGCCPDGNTCHFNNYCPGYPWFGY